MKFEKNFNQCKRIRVPVAVNITVGRRMSNGVYIKVKINITVIEDRPSKVNETEKTSKSKVGKKSEDQDTAVIFTRANKTRFR